MKRSTHVMIVCAYYYAQILGILNFSYDCRRQKAYKSTAITIYSVLMNMLFFMAIPYFSLTLQLKSRPAGSARLEYILNIVITLVRIGAVLFTIVFNWRKRNDFIRLINSFQVFSQRLLEKCQKREKFSKYLEKGIRLKCQSSMISDGILYYVCYWVLHDIFEITNLAVLLALAIIPTILNMIMTHYYLALLNLNACLYIIQDELVQILKVSKVYDLINIKSKLLLRQLNGQSDYVNYLAICIMRLQYYLQRTNNIYQVQGVCCMLIIYLNNICGLYMTYLSSSPDNLWNRINSLSGIFTIFAWLVHYFDLKLFVYSLLDVVHSTQNLAQLLQIEQTLVPFKDNIVERSFLNVSLQLAAFPLENDLVGLYKMSKPMVFSIFSSTITTAIVLKQYDFKYS